MFMETSIEVFWGEPPRERSEIEFLDQLKADLKSSGVSAIILANYFTTSSSRQIDFLVITGNHACHVELKNYPPLLVGTTNGPWSVRRPDDTLEEIDRQNPYTQAFACKMAISDDMQVIAAHDSTVPQPSQRKRFYTQIDSVVCIFPRLDDGSQVPNDYKVRTLGYVDCVRFLTTPGKHPGWTTDHWSALIRMLGLINATEPTERTLSKSIAQDRLSSYTRWFKDFYSRELHELVPLPLVINDSHLSFSGFVDAVRQERHVQLTGPSGAGKSHLARHLLLDMSGRSIVPILVEGTTYEGKLSQLINRSVAPFMTGSGGDLLRAVAITGQTILLVVDGYNECPESLRESLLRDLSAFCRRTSALTLVTSQAAAVVPGPLSGAVAQIDNLADADRQALLSSYGAPEIADLCEPFATAYELAIAAECAGEMDGTVTRSGLFSAFIRRRLSRVGSPGVTRDSLRELALVMDDRLRTSLPLDEAARIVERHLVDLSAPAGVLDEVFKSSITVVRQGRFSFTHVLLGRFLTAEALTTLNRELPDLLQAMRRPRHEDLTQFAVELESDASRAGELLDGLADWHLYALALRGTFGPIARQVSRSAARRLLGAVTQAMDDVTFTIHPEYQLTVAGGYELSAADRELLAAIGSLVREGEFLQEVVSLLDATDAACRRSAHTQAKAERRRPTPSGFVATVLAGLGGVARSTVPAPIILEAVNLTRADTWFQSYRGKPPVGVSDLSPFIEAAAPETYGRLMLLCDLLRALDGPEAAALALRLLRLCWDSGAYHVQLEGLTAIRSFAAEIRDQPLGDEIVDFLESLEINNNVMLSTELVEVLYSYGRVESPYEEEGVIAEIDEILGNPVNKESAGRAYGIVSNIFEDVIGAPFYTAIESLNAPDKVRLFTIAALGAPPYGFSNDWLLTELIKAADRTALPAFERWATDLNLDGFYQQGSTACYILAVQGCALFLDEPPRPANCQTNDQAAWQCYGAIIFWMYRPPLSSEEVSARCAPYWQQLTGELLPAAADPLYQFVWADNSYQQEGGPVYARLIRRFPDEARLILEWNLRHKDLLTSIFGVHARDDRINQIIDMLSLVGDADTIELLRAYTDDKDLGRSAIRAIKQLGG
jgi:hypothetical protein